LYSYRADQDYIVTPRPPQAVKDGWVAGPAGPIRTAAMPTTDGGGWTFSHLKWDEETSRGPLALLPVPATAPCVHEPPDVPPVGCQSGR